MNSNQHELNTSAVDLFTPANRFASASSLYGRLHRWWLLIRKYWWLPLLVFGAILGPAYLFTEFSGPTYESKARMWVPGKINVSENWSYTEELVNFLGTQAALLQSPAIQNRAMARLRAEAGSETALAGLDGANQSQSPGWAKSLLKKLFSSGAPADTNAPPPIPFKVKVLEGAKSSTLELRVTGPNPVATRKFLDCLMAEYLSFKRESRVQTSAHASSSLETEAEQLKNELTAAQRKLQGFKESNNVVMLQQQGIGDENYLASLNRQLAVLRTEQRLLGTLKPEQWVQTDAGQSLGNEAMARQFMASLAESQGELFRADQQMHLLMARRDELAHSLRPEHPKIIKLNQDIATQQRIVKVAQDEAAKQLALRCQALAAQIKNLEISSKEWDTISIETSRKVAEYEQLQQNVQRLQAAYDKSFGLIQNLDLANRVEQENVGILDPSSAAKPTHRLLINLAIAIMLALTVCFGLFYVIALLQDSFASRSELAQQFAEPVLGQIPAISLNSSNGTLGIEGPNQERFEFLEAFRNLRAALLYSNNGGSRPQTIVITSSLPAEGKSTVALYLAVTLARGNSRVLLVDADMRRPSLHRHFGMASGPGLAELLNDEFSASDVIYPTGMNNLTLLPAGAAKRNPGDLMLCPAWDTFLEAVRSQFDFILVDTPPVAATDDAATLAPKMDGVLFIVRALATSARVARGALDVIRQRKAHVVGLIFNGAISSPCDRQYYRYYAHHYNWESEKIKKIPALENHSADTGSQPS